MTIAPGHIVTQERELYRVDGYLVDPGAIPPETLVPFELEMQCYKQPAWHHLKKVPPCLDCDDYQNGGWGCVPGTGDYNNADGQDEETDVSICAPGPSTTSLWLGWTITKMLMCSPVEAEIQETASDQPV